MSRTISLILLLLGVSALSWAGAELLNFQAYPVVDHSQLEWSTGVEENLRVFVVERSSDGSNFFPLGQVSAKGSFSEYRYTDISPLDVDMERTFFYRLKMVDNDGTARYSPTLEVILSFSPVQHTWGSIKAMFR